MRWVDGSEIKIEDFTGEALCEKLASDMHGVCEQYLDCADFIQTAAFLIEFDTELAMQGIFSFLENSIGHYAPISFVHLELSATTETRTCWKKYAGLPCRTSCAANF